MEFSLAIIRSIRCILVSLLLTSTLYGQSISPDVFSRYLRASKSVSTVASVTDFTDTNIYSFLIEGQSTNSVNQMVDTSGYSRHFTTLNSPPIVIVGTNRNGRVENAMRVTAAGNELIYSDPDYSVVAYSNYTVGAWSWIQSGTAYEVDGPLVIDGERNEPSYVDGFYVCPGRTSDNTAFVGTQVGGVYTYIQTPVTVIRNNWQFITVTVQGTNLTVYFNGVYLTNGVCSSMKNINRLAFGRGYNRQGQFYSTWTGYESFMFGCDYAMSSAAIFDLYRYTHPTNNIRIRTVPQYSVNSVHEMHDGVWNYTLAEYLFDSTNLNWNSNSSTSDTSYVGNNPITFQQNVVLNAVTNNGWTNQFYYFNSNNVAYMKGSDIGLPLGSSPRYMSAWIKSKDLVPSGAEGYRWIMYYGSNAPHKLIGIYLDNRTLYGNKPQSISASEGSGGIGTTTTLNTNQWYHIALNIYSTVSWAVYVNGVLETVNSQSYGPVNTVPNGNFYIGTADDNNTHTFNGYIDSIVIASGYVSPTENLAIFNATKGRYGYGTDTNVYSLLFRSWNTNTLGNILDESGNSNTIDAIVGSGIGLYKSGSVNWITNSGANYTAYKTTGAGNYPISNFVMSNSFSEVFWAKMLTYGAAHAFSILGGNTAVGDSSCYMLGTAGNHIRFYVQSANSANYDLYDTATTISDTNWHHFAMSWDKPSRTIKLYIDAVENGQPTTRVGSTPISTASGPAYIGGHWDAVASLNGSLDYFGIMQYVITPSGVTNLYQNTYPLAIL